jgi:hypothetical protein
MPEIERYEILILGSGEAGKYLAWNGLRHRKQTMVDDLIAIHRERAPTLERVSMGT